MKVYDIGNAGPRNRFTIKTDSGYLIVHNCQYGVGAKKFGDRLYQQGISLGPTPEEHYAEATRIIRVYRSKNSAIVNFWSICESVIAELMAGGSGYFGGPTGKLFHYDGNHDIFGRKVPGIRLPNGYWLCYPNLRWEQIETIDGPKWVKVYDRFFRGRKTMEFIYSGAAFNNLCQGTAFAALTWQAVRINRSARIVLNVHDEYMSCVREEQEQEAIETYNYWLRKAPPWCEGVPFDCEVSSGKRYGSLS